jgi:hypothetical protein
MRFYTQSHRYYSASICMLVGCNSAFWIHEESSAAP